MTMTISRTDLARRTREALEHAQRGEAVFIESYGTEQAAIIDAKEYYLLRAVAMHRNRPLAPVTSAEMAPRGLTEDEVQARVAAAGGDRQEAWIAVIAAYLDGDISLGRAAVLLGVSRFELQAHFNRLGLPVQPAPLSLNEARAEYTAIRADDAR